MLAGELGAVGGVLSRVHAKVSFRGEPRWCVGVARAVAIVIASRPARVRGQAALAAHPANRARDEPLALKGNDVWLQGREERGEICLEVLLVATVELCEQWRIRGVGGGGGARQEKGC